MKKKRKQRFSGTSTDGRRPNARTSFLFRNEAATFGAKDTDSSSFSVASGKRQTSALNTFPFFPFWNKAAFATKCAEEKEEEKSSRRREAAGRREAASRGSCTGRERARSSNVTKAGSESSQGSRNGRKARYAVAGRLDEYGSGNLQQEQRASRPRSRTGTRPGRRSRRGFGATATASCFVAYFEKFKIYTSQKCTRSYLRQQRRSFTRPSGGEN
jgi:hypothetical protein